MFPPNPAEIWSNVSTRCENVADTTTEKHHENGVCVLFGMLRGTTSCKMYVPGSLEAPEKGSIGAVSYLQFSFPCLKPG